MILHSTGSRVIDNYPAADDNRLWIYESFSGDAYPVVISRAPRITLHAGRNNLFAVVHHYHGEQLELTAHSIDEPTHVISRVQVWGTTWRFEGAEEVWRYLPRFYLAYYTPDRLADADHHLVEVNTLTRTVSIRAFPPLIPDSLPQKDRITDLCEVPGRSEVLLEEGRDEKPLLFFNTRQMKTSQRLALSIKPGTARTYRFRNAGTELWVSDPEHLVKLTRNVFGTWAVRATLRLQLMDTTAGRYTGEFAFSPDEKTCLLARPCLGDLILIDAERFQIRERISMTGMPLRVALLGNGRFVTRDMNYGRVLEAARTRAAA